MQAELQPDPPPSAAPAALRLFKKVAPEDVPVTAESAALFRFGEQCNNHCPMCSNTGDAALFLHPTAELLRRAAFLHGCGFRRVVVTGGEATIHPGFWTVIEQLATYGMTWDTNTHGRSFSKQGFAARALALGLRRAIVSLHSHDPAIDAAIFGANEEAHHETVAGIERLLQAGVEVMINCVLSRLNLAELDSFLPTTQQRFGRQVAVKFVFPSTIGKGGRWGAIAGLRYDDVSAVARRLAQLGERLQLQVWFESFPNCVLQNPRGINLGRSSFGESHYLDDASGDRIYSMRHIETELSVYAEGCRTCLAARRCPGISIDYAKHHGIGELTPFERMQSGPRP